MHGPAHRLVSAKRKRDVRNTPRNLHQGKFPADLSDRLDEIQAVGIVLLDAGGDGKNVGVENNVFRGKGRFFRQQLVGPPANFDPSFYAGRLAFLIEGHDHGGGPEPP